MKNILSPIFLAVLFMSLYSCGIFSPNGVASPPSATRSGPRTIVLDGDTISEEVVGEFTCWYCKDHNDYYGPTLVEVGFIDNPDYDFFGFVLYDGGYSGEYAIYQRTGLVQRWDWGPGGNYTFTIKQDGFGQYYDFTAVPEGESTKPIDTYECYKR